MQLINNKKKTVKSKGRGVKFKYHTEIIPYDNLFKNFIKIVCGIYFIFLKSMGGQKLSLNLVGPGQGQRPPVFLFYTIYIGFKTYYI